MSGREACIELLKTAIIEDSYDKRNYPRCLEDLSEREMKETFGENTFNSYKEANYRNESGFGHLALLRTYKRNGEKFSIERMILDGSERGYQQEMICSIECSCLAIPEEVLYPYIFRKKSTKQLSRIFQYPEFGVKLRLIKFYYDNVIQTLEKHMEAERGN